jgi:hypothetical protein
MTITEFDQLTTHEKFVALWDNGKYLCHRKEGKYYYTLYQMEGLYLELIYNSVNKTVEGYKSYGDPNIE